VRNEQRELPMIESSRPTVVVLGSANMDLVGRAPRLPLAGETVLGTSFSRHPGGKGANQAVAAARAGARTAFIGAVGADPFAEELANSMERAGVDVVNLRLSSDESTGIALIVVDEAGRNQITVLPGANGQVGERDVHALQGVIAAGSVLLLQLEIPVESVARAARMAREAGATVVLNPAPATELPDALLASVDVLVPNEREARTLAAATDDEPIESVAATLRVRGPSVVVVTLGESGALILDDAGARRTPAFSVDAVDTTAAGDAFLGGFAAARAEGKPLDLAVRFATATAALSVQRRGAQPSVPSRFEIDRFLGSREA
jgi:ribokinase